LDARVETGVADRRWAHVDATPSRAEIERGTDDGDLAGPSDLQSHGRQG
jgi:hypothetical protein